MRASPRAPGQVHAFSKPEAHEREWPAFAERRGQTRSGMDRGTVRRFVTAIPPCQHALPRRGFERSPRVVNHVPGHRKSCIHVERPRRSVATRRGHGATPTRPTTGPTTGERDLSSGRRSRPESTPKAMDRSGATRRRPEPEHPSATGRQRKTDAASTSRNGMRGAGRERTSSERYRPREPRPSFVRITRRDAYWFLTSMRSRKLQPAERILAHEPPKSGSLPRRVWPEFLEIVVYGTASRISGHRSAAVEQWRVGAPAHSRHGGPGIRRS